MPKFRISVSESSRLFYNEEIIEVENEEEAKKTAEWMRCEGRLKEGDFIVDEVIIDVMELEDSPKSE